MRIELHPEDLPPEPAVALASMIESSAIAAILIRLPTVQYRLAFPWYSE